MFDNFNDEDDDFDFDHYLNESSKQFESNLEEFRERMMAHAIESNYKSIEDKGISEWHLRHMEIEELAALALTLNTMIDYFVDVEEYEKCSMLKGHLSNIEDVAKSKKNA